MPDKTERVYRGKRQMIFHNFLGGLSWGVGVTFGLAIFIALLVALAKTVDLVPVVGDFVADILNYLLITADVNPRIQ
jgi:hypothetical protein